MFVRMQAKHSLFSIGFFTWGPLPGSINGSLNEEGVVRKQKVSFLFCSFCTEKFNYLIIFLYFLEEKDLNYQVSTENKPKFKFLSPKIK